MGLSDNEKRLVLAIGQTMFPRDSILPIDADDAGIVAWVEDYLERMPTFSRTQIRALLQTFDYGYAAWAMRPSASFAAAKPQDRADYLASWEQSTTYTQRQLYEALRAMFTFAYVESEAVTQAIRPSKDGAEKGSQEAS